MGCVVCDTKENIIYENDNIVIMFPEKPSTSGHLQIFPKRHITIMEQLSEEESAYIIKAANIVSTILFEALKVHGTNIIINNGSSAGQTIPHFSINIIPRRTDDGLNLEWDMKKTSEESLDSTKQIITDNITHEEEFEERNKLDKDNEELKEHTENSKKLAEDKSIENNSLENSEKKNKYETSKKTNFWLKSLERIP